MIAAMTTAAIAIGSATRSDRAAIESAMPMADGRHDRAQRYVVRQKDDGDHQKDRERDPGLQGNKRACAGRDSLATIELDER